MTIETTKRKRKCRCCEKEILAGTKVTCDDIETNFGSKKVSWCLSCSVERLERLMVTYGEILNTLKGEDVWE